MKRTPLLLAVLLAMPLLSCVVEDLPDVDCSFQLPAPGTERVPSGAGFNLVVQVIGEFTSEQLAAVHFVSDVEAAGSDYENGVVLEGAITIDEGGCSNGCQAGGRLETSISPGPHTIQALVLTPRGTSVCETNMDLVVNAPPVVGSVSLSPETPRTGDDITFIAEASDDDGDTVQLSNTWTGPDGQALTSLSLTPIQTAVGQLWTLEVTPRDDYDVGESVTLDVTIANTDPSAPVVTIHPAPGRVDSALICKVTTLEDLDEDDDELTVTWSWSLDGVEASVTDATIPAASTTAGDVWACSATVNDGTGTSEAGSASTTVVAPLTLPSSSELNSHDLVAGISSAQYVGDAGLAGSPGDVDGDGRAEFVIADNDGVCTVTCEGQAHAYLFLGSSEPQATSLDSHTTDFQPPAGIRILAPQQVGDLNGDGIDDLVLPFRNAGWSTSQGNSGVYIVFGDTAGWDAVVDLEETAVKISATAESLGALLAQIPCPVGDLDGDGINDLALTAPGAAEYRGMVYIIYGHPGTWVSGLSPDMLSPSFYLRGGPDDLSGTGVSGHELGQACAGPLDVDGDGLFDLVLGAPRGGATGSGWALVYLGDGTRWEGEQTSAMADIIVEGDPIESVDATALTTRFGYSMAAMGDHDGDGIDDFAISGLGPVNDDAKDGGTVWIASGGDDAFVGSLSASSLPSRIRGEGNLGFCGHPVGVDLDGDGLGDLACGDIRPEDADLICPDDSDPCNDPVPSAVRVFLGDGGDMATDRAYDDADLLLLASQSDDWVGASMARLPDRDGNDYDELLVGAPGLDVSPYGDSGAVYVVDLAE